MTLEQALTRAWTSGRRHVLLLGENGSGNRQHVSAADSITAAESTEVVLTDGTDLLSKGADEADETKPDKLHLKMEPREMSISEFMQAADTSRERLNCLTEGAPFSFEVHDHTITVDIPLTAFQGEDIATVLESYVTRECRFFLMDYRTLS